MRLSGLIDVQQRTLRVEKMAERRVIFTIMIMVEIRYVQQQKLSKLHYLESETNIFASHSKLPLMG